MARLALQKVEIITNEAVTLAEALGPESRP